LVFLIYWEREFYSRPKTVAITDDGMLLFYRYKKQRFVSWSEMAFYYARFENTSTAWGRFAQGGSIGLNKGFPIQLSPEIASEVKNKYRERTGSVLPDYHEFGN